MPIRSSTARQAFLRLDLTSVLINCLFLLPAAAQSQPLADAHPALTNDSVPALDVFVRVPVLVDEVSFARAPRIVATADQRMLLSRGDRAYVRGPEGLDMPLPPTAAPAFQVLRPAVALKDPATGAVIGHAAQAVGRAVLVRGELSSTTARADGQPQVERLPETIHIVQAHAEIRVGDRLLPEPAANDRPPPADQPLRPHAPAAPLNGQVVSLADPAFTHAAQHQLVVINRGRAHGVERGRVLALQQDRARLVDTLDPARTPLQLPAEHKGQLVVVRPFEQLSYALVLQVRDGVKIGDRFTSP
jgi:hypothetical protein